MGERPLTEKINNPQDHYHNDYANVTAFAYLWLVVLTIFAAIGSGVCQEVFDRNADTNQRIDELECRLAEDEAECLKGILEEQR